MSRLFGHGDLRLYLLMLLEERPRHGYDLISQLEARFLGLYSPSPGTVYPRLAALEEEGYVVSHTESGRKVYELTDKGRAELAERAQELKDLGQRVARSAREMAREIREEVRSSVRELRQDVRTASRDIRREERRRGRETKHGKQAHARPRGELSGAVRSLQGDLEAFVTDVVAAARKHRLDRSRLEALREALTEARGIIIGALEGEKKDER